MSASNIEAAAGMKTVYSAVEAMRFKPGRRAWISYRDLGVEEATNGAMRAEIMHIDEGGDPRPTGWHYHTAKMQFLMVTEGWVDIEFPDTGVTHLKAGESLMIPGGVVHQELSSSSPLRLLEVTLPAKMDTVPVPESEVTRRSAETVSD